MRGHHRQAQPQIFATQQQALGAVNGYIEERLGQKVKVFNHEDVAINEFEF